MPQIYLCFLWHMHQPFYKDLVTGAIQPAVDAPARAQRLLRHGAHAGGISQGPSDLQPGAVDDGAGGGIRSRRSARSVSRVRGQAGRGADGCRARLHPRSFLPRQSGAHDLSLPALWRSCTKPAAHRRIPRTPSWRSALRTFAICRCFRNWPGSTKNFSRTIPDVRALIRKGRNFDLADQALMARKAEADPRAGDSGLSQGRAVRADRNFDHALLSSDSAAALRFRHRRRLASRRPAAAAFPLPGGRCAVSSRWRASSSQRSLAPRPWACGHRKARYPTRSSGWPPRRDSSGPPPTAACWTARWAAAAASTASIVRTGGRRKAARSA